MMKLLESKCIEYVREGGRRCPNCNSAALQGEDCQAVDWGLVERNVHCLECKIEWTDSYRLQAMILPSVASLERDVTELVQIMPDVTESEGGAK